MPAGRDHLARVTLALAALAVALIGSELVLRRFLPAPNVYRVHWPGLHAVFHPNSELMPGVSGTAHFEVCSLGVRAPRPPVAGEIPILAVGGSTTEETMLDLDETWTQRVRRMTTAAAPLWVGNAGRSGHGTREQLLPVHELLRTVPETRVLLLLVGGNDFLRRLAEDAAYDPGAVQRADFEQITTPRAFASFPAVFRRGDPFWRRSELWRRLARGFLDLRLAWAARRAGLVQVSAVDAIAAWRDQRRHAAGFRDTLPDLGPALAEYAANLTEIVRRVRAAGAEPLLLTQPTIWRADLPPELVDTLWLGGIGDFRRPGVRADYYTPSALAEGMARYNAALLEVCAKVGAPCLDLAPRIPKDGSAFDDDMHFTEAGAERVAREVSAALASTLQ